MTKKILKILHPGILLNIFGKSCRTPCEYDITNVKDNTIKSMMTGYGISNYKIINTSCFTISENNTEKIKPIKKLNKIKNKSEIVKIELPKQIVENIKEIKKDELNKIELNKIELNKIEPIKEIKIDKIENVIPEKQIEIKNEKIIKNKSIIPKIKQPIIEELNSVPIKRNKKKDINIDNNIKFENLKDVDNLLNIRNKKRGNM